jgi:phosphopantetheine adenylyltransferase
MKKITKRESCLGVPILRRDDAAFMLRYDRDFKHFDYETKVKVFAALDPAVTSLMTTKQIKEYMDAMQRHFAQAGVYLTDPELQKYGVPA